MNSVTMSDGENFHKTVGHIAYGFFKSFLQEQKENLDIFFVKNKVGFLPEGLDYSIYRKLQKSTIFRQLKFLIGKDHPTIRIVLTGLYLNSLDRDTRFKCVDENKDQVYKKHGREGVSILNMASTGFMESFIRWLSKYALDNKLSQQEIISSYEQNVKDWDKRTIFVKKEHGVNYIQHRCKVKLGEGLMVFFMFASGGAVKIAEETYNNLKEDQTFLESNYIITPQYLNDSKFEMVWIFEKRSEYDLI